MWIDHKKVRKSEDPLSEVDYHNSGEQFSKKEETHDHIDYDDLSLTFADITADCKHDSSRKVNPAGFCKPKPIEHDPKLSLIKNLVKVKFGD